MIVCKVCECGTILEYEPPFEDCPDPCPNCGRLTQEYNPYRRDDPIVQRLREDYLHRNMEVVQTIKSDPEEPQQTEEAPGFPVHDLQAEAQSESGENVQDNNNGESHENASAVKPLIPPADKPPIPPTGKPLIPPADKPPIPPTGKPPIPPTGKPPIPPTDKPPVNATEGIPDWLAQKPEKDAAESQEEKAPEPKKESINAAGDIPSWFLKNPAFGGESEQIEKKRETKVVYRLRSMNSDRMITLPQEECIVGRTGVGCDELAHNNGVSREHLRVTPGKRQRGITITDLSRYGTKVNGNPIIKGQPQFIGAGTRVALFNEEFILEAIDEEV